MLKKKKKKEENKCYEINKHGKPKPKHFILFKNQSLTPLDLHIKFQNL